MTLSHPKFHCPVAQWRTHEACAGKFIPVSCSVFGPRYRTPGENGHSTWPQLEHRASFHAAGESAKAAERDIHFSAPHRQSAHPGRVAKGMLHGIDLSDPRDDQNIGIDKRSAEAATKQF
jgi:hypothetical protein